MTSGFLVVFIHPFTPFLKCVPHLTGCFLLCFASSRKVKADDFKKEVSFQLIMNQINNLLGSVIDGYNVSLRTKLWTALDTELCLKECNIYSYIPDPDSDPFADEGNMYVFGSTLRLFFHNCHFDI